MTRLHRAFDHPHHHGLPGDRVEVEMHRVFALQLFVVEERGPGGDHRGVGFVRGDGAENRVELAKDFRCVSAFRVGEDVDLLGDYLRCGSGLGRAVRNDLGGKLKTVNVRVIVMGGQVCGEFDDGGFEERRVVLGHLRFDDQRMDGHFAGRDDEIAKFRSRFAEHSFCKLAVLARVAEDDRNDHSGTIVLLRHWK